MGLYFLNEMMRRPGSHEMIHEAFDVPIKIEQGTWVHLEEPRRISKIFTFDDAGQLRFFITEFIKNNDTRHHDVKIIIQSDTVQIESRTETIDDITALDLEIARSADNIYDDSQFILEVE